MAGRPAPKTCFFNLFINAIYFIAASARAYCARAVFNEPISFQIFKSMAAARPKNRPAIRSLANHQHRHMGMRQHLRGDAAQHQFFKPAPAMRTHHHQVSIQSLCRVQNSLVTDLTQPLTLIGYTDEKF